MNIRILTTAGVLALMLAMRSAAEDVWSLIFYEGFENGGSMPTGWTQEHVDGTKDWAFVDGDELYDFPTSAYAGSYNAFFFDDYGAEYTTKLVSSAIAVDANYSGARLTFWHYMKEWDLEQDELRVYYKTAPGGSWTLLTNFVDNVTQWTQRTIDLPAAGQTYYIAFEGSTFWGFGVCIDEVKVEGFGSASEGFEAWAQEHCPGLSLNEAFVADSDADGVQNGFEYAFGANLGEGALLLNVLQVDGDTVVDVPQQLSETEPYVSVYVEMTRSLAAPVWSTNGIESVTHAQKPAIRSWVKPAESLTNGFFRLRGDLLQ